MESYDPLTELSILYEIASISFKIQNLQEIIQFAVEKAVDLLRNDAAVFFLIDEESDTLIPSSSLGIQLHLISSIPSKKISKTLQPIELTKKNIKFDVSDILKSSYQASNMICFNLFYQKKRKGVLLIIRSEKSELTELDFKLMNFLKSRIEISLENYFIFKEKEFAVKELKIDKKKLKNLNSKLEKKNAQIKIMNEYLYTKSRTDFLTNLYNRRAIIELLHAEINKIRRKESSIDKNSKKYLALALVDIDHFKKINDEFGHDMGDEVLKYIGTILTDNKHFRNCDICGRFGGDEFLIFIPNINFDNVLIPLQRFHQNIKKTEFHDKYNNKKFSITISIGVSFFNDTDKDYDEVIKRADVALYKAKNLGRDRIFINSDS